MVLMPKLIPCTEKIKTRNSEKAAFLLTDFTISPFSKIIIQLIPNSTGLYDVVATFEFPEIIKENDDRNTLGDNIKLKLYYLDATLFTFDRQIKEAPDILQEQLLKCLTNYGYNSGLALQLSSWNDNYRYDPVEYYPHDFMTAEHAFDYIRKYCHYSPLTCITKVSGCDYDDIFTLDPQKADCDLSFDRFLPKDVFYRNTNKDNSYKRNEQIEKVVAEFYRIKESADNK